MIELAGMAGAVTAITGFEKGSGKTTFLSHAQAVVRHAGPAAVFTIGVDGAQKAKGSQLSPPEIHVGVGDIVLTTEPFARSSSAKFEILEVIPGRSSLGALFLGRVAREGSVTLVGSDHLGVMAELIHRVQREQWAQTVLVDGAVNRVTQLRALGDVNFVFTARIDRANLVRTAARIRNVAALAALPTSREAGAHFIEGVVTSEILASLPPGVTSLVIEDFTKVFLEQGELTRALGRFHFSVRHPVRLLCFAVTLRDVSRDHLLEFIGPRAAEKVLFNPYEAAS